MSESGAERIADAVRGGDVRTAARLMRDLDDRRPGAQQSLRLLWRHTGQAFVLGITGNPGAGKSTVVDGLIALYRRAGLRVGVVSIDPTSPFSGGAILGDRIRMQRHATDDGVFIRSLATRGHLGGLSRSTAEVVAVLDAMGFAVIIIETVGVGQAEVDVVAQADITVVVTVPGMGDEVQAIKAGLLEVADLVVVNKGDKPGALRTAAQLRAMLVPTVARGEAPADRPAPKRPEVLVTTATTGEGVPELLAALDRHRDAARDGLTKEARRARARAQIQGVLADRLADRMREPALAPLAESIVAEVAEHRLDPYAAADRLLEAMAKAT